jgi:hypothetical protein
VPRPVQSAAAPRKAQRDGRGRGRVADPHLARHQKVGPRVDRVPARRQRLGEPGRIHRGALGEIRRGSVERDGHNVEPRARHLGQLVDRRPARLEIRHHLRGDIGGKGADPLRRHAVVAREDGDLGRAIRAVASPRQPQYQIASSSSRPSAPGGLVNCPLRASAAAREVSSGPGAVCRTAASSAPVRGAVGVITRKSPLPSGGRLRDV